MSLPPLPDIFGNYVLGEFNEVAAPAAIDWMPQTPGWYVLAAALGGLFLRWGWRRLAHWYRNRYRREAKQRLQALTLGQDTVVEVNRLLKLTAMAAYSRQQVASLSGEEWTQFLNAQCNPAPFSQHHCALLAEGIYRQPEEDSAAASSLLQASLSWVEHHRSRYDA